MHAVASDAANYLGPTGNRLLLLLESAKVSDQALARGFVLGVIAASPQRGLYCFDLPATTSEDQLLEIVTASIKANPNPRHLPASVQVQYALSVPFPCRSHKLTIQEWLFAPQPSNEPRPP